MVMNINDPAPVAVPNAPAPVGTDSGAPVQTNFGDGGTEAYAQRLAQWEANQAGQTGGSPAPTPQQQQWSAQQQANWAAANTPAPSAPPEPSGGGGHQAPPQAPVTPQAPTQAPTAPPGQQTKPNKAPEPAAGRGIADAGGGPTNAARTFAQVGGREAGRRGITGSVQSGQSLFNNPGQNRFNAQGGAGIGRQQRGSSMTRSVGSAPAAALSSPSGSGDGEEGPGLEELLAALQLGG